MTLRMRWTKNPPHRMEGRLTMACNNGLFGGNCCTWIIILLILFCCCGDNFFGGNCGCDDFRGGNCGCGCWQNEAHFSCTKRRRTPWSRACALWSAPQAHLAERQRAQQGEIALWKDFAESRPGENPGTAFVCSDSSTHSSVLSDLINFNRYAYLPTVFYNKSSPPWLSVPKS